MDKLGRLAVAMASTAAAGPEFVTVRVGRHIEDDAPPPAKVHRPPTEQEWMRIQQRRLGLRTQTAHEKAQALVAAAEKRELRKRRNQRVAGKCHTA